MCITMDYLCCCNCITVHVFMTCNTINVEGATIGPSNRQVLDTLQVERERGITVKAQTASLFYNYKEDVFLLNLIDTPVGDMLPDQL